MRMNELQIKCNSFMPYRQRDRSSLRKNLNYKINVTQNIVPGNRAAMRNELQKIFMKAKAGIF